ncbi:hypothetical protein ACFOD4_21400, partial [Pseudoroseomonas globiformis]
MPSSTSADLIRTIVELSPTSPEKMDSTTASALCRATRRLMETMRQEGRLLESPMELALTRS